MHPSDLRHINASRIFHAIRLQPNISQREIVDATGADKSTVSTVIRSFEAEGLIERSQSRTTGGPGRPGERIILSRRGGLLVGVHPRPEGIRYVVSGLDGEPLHALTGDLPKPARLGREINASITTLTAAIGRVAADVRAVGVCVPGLITHEGQVSQSPNLGWRNLSLRGVLSKQVRQPLYFDNNANAAAMAEYLFGRGSSNFVYVESGSGVGAGLFLNDALYRGAHGFAGEFGHTKIVPQGRACRCGGLGCLSAYASDYSIIQRLGQRGVDAPTREAVFTSASTGNPTTLAVLEEAGRHLGTGLANLVNLLDLQLFILGGGFAVLAQFMTQTIRESLAELALPAAMAGCRIEHSSLGSWELPLGGIALALEGCTSHVRTESTPW